MRLVELITNALTDAGKKEQMISVAPISEHDVSGITCDSRNVVPGYVFAALPGINLDGRDFIAGAIDKGAIAIIAEQGTELKDLASPVALITDENPRQLYAKMAGAFYGAQPDCIAAITGTNGKTSVATFARQLWSGLGLKAGSVGTLGVQASGGGGSDRLDVDVPGSLTTPDPADLHKSIAALTAQAVTHLAMEASSHGLDQYRLDGFKINIAAFTNLTRDHLDYHGDFASYGKSKRRLFEELLEQGGTAVLNADTPEFSDLETLCEKRGCPVMSYGKAGRAIALLERVPHNGGQQVKLNIAGEVLEIDLPLIGAFQVENVLCALGIVMASGAEIHQVIKLLPTLEGVRGRLEHVANLPNSVTGASRTSGASVYVDFAHTADALESMLQTLRPHVRGRLLVLFGCGGDRDPGKRAPMGTAAANNADYVILSDDNPRSEDPASIRAQALVGCPEATEIGDRAAAIAHGISMLQQGDLFVIAGKGHEQGQIIGDEVRPFDDASVARSIIGEIPT